MQKEFFNEFYNPRTRNIIASAYKSRKYGAIGRRVTAGKETAMGNAEFRHGDCLRMEADLSCLFLQAPRPLKRKKKQRQSHCRDECEEVYWGMTINRIPPVRRKGSRVAGSALSRAALFFLALVSLTGCALAPRYDFPAIFSMARTAGEALDALQPPQIITLQDDMTLYVWEGRKEIMIPAHTEYVRSRWPRRDGFFEYYEMWIPDTTQVLWCNAKIISDPAGRIVYRTWDGNACESFVRHLPAWYDRDNPDVRKNAPVTATRPAPEQSNAQ